MKALLRNRWARRVGVPVLIVGLFVAAAILLARLVMPSREGVEERDHELAELDAAEPGWRWEDLYAAHLSKRPPADENIAERVHRIFDRFPEGWGGWQHLPADEEQELDPGPPSHDSGSPPPLPVGCLPTKRELAQARNLVGMCHELIPDARSLRHLKTGGAKLEVEPTLYMLLRHIDRLERVATLLEQDALVTAVDGHPDDALDDALALLALARGIGEEPILTSQLVRGRYARQAARVVERTLGLGEPSATKLTEVRDALLAEAEVPRLLVGLRGERALLYRFAENVESGREDRLKLEEVTFDGMRVFPNEMLAALRPEGQVRFLRLLNRMVIAAKLPPDPDRAAAFAAIDRDVEADTTSIGKGVRRLVAASRRLHDPDAETVAVLRAADVALACERHRLKTGAFPAALADLPKELLAEVPTDPFTGKPILFKPTADGLVVYSTGADGNDDGGNLKPESKPGFDIGVRLFHPQHRRQPPVEKP